MRTGFSSFVVARVGTALDELDLEGTGVDRRLLMEDAALLFVIVGLIEATGGADSVTSQLHFVISIASHDNGITYSKEFAKSRIVWLAGLSLDVLQILREPEPADF